MFNEIPLAEMQHEALLLIKKTALHFYIFAPRNHHSSGSEHRERVFICLSMLYESFAVDTHKNCRQFA